MADGATPCSRGQIEFVEDAASVHQLDENPAPFLVHGIGDGSPSDYVLAVEQPGDSSVAQSLGRWRCALGDDQASTSALAVVRHHHLVRNAPRRAAARHGRHHDMVGESYGAELVGFESLLRH